MIGAAVAAFMNLAAGSIAAGIVAGVVNGAIIGAVVGGVSAAVTGGNVLKGMLRGGLTGAIGGGILGGLSAAAAGGGLLTGPATASTTVPATATPAQQTVSTSTKLAGADAQVPAANGANTGSVVKEIGTKAPTTGGEEGILGLGDRSSSALIQGVGTLAASALGGEEGPETPETPTVNDAILSGPLALTGSNNFTGDMRDLSKMPTLATETATPNAAGVVTKQSTAIPGSGGASSMTDYRSYAA
jgi:hypothetical protein